MSEHHSYDLERFVEAQAPVFEGVLAELRGGEKRSHWMWFIFPQIRGLGYSAMAERYAIASREEAAAYLDHPALGERLRQCTELVLDVEGGTVEQIFGYPDDLKFHSSMTLFAAVSSADSIFEAALRKYFNGALDQATIERL
jgi:uncharacterized protein (DUF1810 family)